MKGKRFIGREEYFGGTVVDRKNLTFKFYNPREWKCITDLRKEGDRNEMEIRYGLTPEEKDKLLANGLFQHRDSGDDAVYLVHSDIHVMKSDEPADSLPRGILRSPLRVYFEITRKCNLRCKNCFSSSGLPYDNELSNKEVKKIIDNMRKANTLEVRITGGEPTRREDLFDLISHAKSSGLAVSLNSNGIYDNPEETREKIIKAGVDQVIISLDGSEESHDTLRGQGNYRRTLDTITYFTDRNRLSAEPEINVRVNTILSRKSIPNIPKIIQMAKDYKTELCFILLRPIGRGSGIYDAVPSTAEIYSATQQINELRAKAKDTTVLTSFDIISRNAGKITEDLDLTGCAAGLRGIGVSSRGNLEACGFLAELGSDYSLGNIREHDYDMQPVWRGSEKLKAFRERNIKRTNSCRGCGKYNSTCFGSCVVMEYFKDVNDVHKDPYCAIDME